MVLFCFFQISKCQHANLPNADGKCDSNSTSFVTLSLQLCINEASQSNSKPPKPSIVLTKYLLKKSILISPYWTVRHCVFTVNALACSPRKKCIVPRVFQLLFMHRGLLSNSTEIFNSLTARGHRCVGLCKCTFNILWYHLRVCQWWYERRAAKHACWTCAQNT